MTRMRYVLGLILLIAGLGAQAQNLRMKQAQKYMDGLDFIEAIKLYQQVLSKDDNPEAKINLADCYRRVNDPVNAEIWYAQVVELPESKPIHKLHYGMMLQRNGKCDLAKEWFKAYLQENPGDTRGQFLAKGCEFERDLNNKNKGIYEVQTVTFNGPLDDMAPTIYKDGVVFSSERDKGGPVSRVHAWTGNPFLELYHVPAKKSGEDSLDVEFGNPLKFSKDLNTKFHDAKVSFSPDQGTIYYTRNNIDKNKVGRDDEGVVRLKIYKATKNGEFWDNLTGLPFNSDEYSVAHPALSADGKKMYFASDMPGGFGGFDLYVVTAEGGDGNWGVPLNLGPGVNTEGNEIFPLFDNGRLYFSSDGHVGLGGLDLYFVEDKGNETFGPVENMGAPMNSTGDDFCIAFEKDGTTGYFTSDREGGAGRDDIYRFVKNALPVEIFVFDEATKEPIAEAKVERKDNKAVYMTGKDGKTVVDLKRNTCADFHVTFEGYEEADKNACAKKKPGQDKILVEVPLRKKSNYVLEGIVVDESTGEVLKNAKVTIKNDCGKEDIVLTSDNEGFFTTPVPGNCCFEIRGEYEGYIDGVVRDQCTKGESSELTLQVVVNLLPIKTAVAKPDVVETPAPPVEEPKETKKRGKKEKNKKEPEVVVDNTPKKEPETFAPGITPTEPGESAPYLLNIYYDFDQAYLRDESEPSLNKLYTMMKDNPEYVVEIGAHTDSRGSYSYNRRLSQRRAEAVVRWLIERGIDRDRLIAIGYGETRNVNNCKNFIPCSEQQHQMNRRTEFRIVGTVENNGTDVILFSRPMENPRVDPCHGCPF